MQIRAATSDDALAIERARIHAWRVAYRHVFPSDELDALPIDAKRWRTRLADPPAGWSTFVAVDDEASVVGFVSTGPSRDEPGIGELYAIYVHPDAWSAGAGRALIERAEAALRSEYTEATLWVLEDNPRARPFYERAGWQPDGARKVESRLGVRAAEVRYRKTLRTSSRS
ncbi:MAG TPA: GNAT family N-acetyltransferase [Gaiellaceae bacterium]|nr:GNAT family N-acetyltransferase [Gaiellaceae bacterium]